MQNVLVQWLHTFRADRIHLNDGDHIAMRGTDDRKHFYSYLYYTLFLTPRQHYN